MSLTTYPGNPYPLGATLDNEGVNFALFAENALAVDLCLFHSLEDEHEFERIRMTERTHHVWHIYLPQIKAGQLYGFRVQGSFDPFSGHRFNPNKLLIDPYAKAISGTIKWHDSLFGYAVGHHAEDLSYSELDSAPYIPKSVVINPNFDWEGDKLLKI